MYDDIPEEVFVDMKDEEVFDEWATHGTIGGMSFRAEIPITKIYEKTPGTLDFETDVVDAAARLNHYFQKIGYLAVAM